MTALSRTYPIVLSQGGTVTPAAPGTPGANGTTVLKNTVATPIAVSAIGEATLSSYTVVANSLVAGDVLEIEALFTATNTTVFGGKLSMEIDGNEVTLINVDNTGLGQTTDLLQPVPNPALNTSQYAFKLKCTFLVKSAAAQVASGSFHPISWGVPEKPWMPINLAADLTNAVVIALKSNLTSITGSMSCIYFKIIKQAI